MIETSGVLYLNKAQRPAPRRQQTFPKDIGSLHETPLPLIQHGIDPGGIHTRFNLGISFVHSLAFIGVDACSVETKRVRID